MRDSAEGPGEAPAAVEFELTPEEWIEVSLEHAMRSPLVRQARRMVRILLGVLVLLAAWLSVVTGAPSAALMWLLAGGVVTAFMGPILRSAQRRQVSKYAETGITNGMFGPHRVELRPEGVLDSTEGYEWLTRWPSIERVEEGEGCFLIYTGPNALLPIPHTAFPDSESLRRFSRAFFALKAAGGRPTPLIEGPLARDSHPDEPDAP